MVYKSLAILSLPIRGIGRYVAFVDGAVALSGRGSGTVTIVEAVAGGKDDEEGVDVIFGAA